MNTGSDPTDAGWLSGKGLSRNAILGAALIVVALLLAYLPAIRGGYIWDDDAYVTSNPLLTAPDGWRQIWFSAHSQSQYFPLTYSTLRLERMLWGLNPLGYHLVNVLFHAANALLAWLLLRRLSVPGAWLAAALFALHPVQVETAAWITELKNTQSTFFYLLALLAWIQFADDPGSRRRLFYGAALSCYTLALFSKTTACTLPAAMILVLWLRHQPIDRQRWLHVAPFILIGLGMGLVSVWWEGHLGDYISQSGVKWTLWQRLLVASRALWFYIGKLVWPSRLTFSYPRWDIHAHTFGQYAPLAACVALAPALWLGRRILGRGPVVAVAFYVATLSPLLGFFPLYTFYYSFVADHYQYLACLGPFALIAAALSRAAVRWRVQLLAQVAFCAALLGGLSALTLRQAGIYHDAESLWRDTLRKNPDSWLALNNLGRLLLDRGDRAAAEPLLQRALQLNPNDADILYNVGKAQADSGRIAEALPYYEHAVQSKPHSSAMHYNYGNLLAASGNFSGAIAQYREALKLRPDDPDAHNNLAVALYSTKQWDLAAEQFREAIRCKPDSANFHCNLGNVLLALHRRVEAAEEYTRALQLNPDCAEAKARLRAMAPSGANGYY